MTRVMILVAMLVFQTSRAATVTFDGGVTYQTIDGFGANINHRSWNNDDLKPVIDALVDEAGMTLFRVIYDKADWEATNDNSSAHVMNWAYYNQVYSSPDFQKLWGLTAYLNQKGISNGVMFNFQGNGPAWLGSPALKPGLEPEWAEMVASLLIYARQTNHLQFGLVGPDNEMDQTSQAVNMTASQYVTALRDLSQLLDSNGMSDLKFVGPDLAVASTTYMSQMLADPVVRSKIAHFGAHSYGDGGNGSAAVYNYIQGSAYPDRTFWMTEFNVWCPVCDFGQLGTYDWAYCEGTAEYLMQHLLNNASAGLVWEGYDSQYNYTTPLGWSFWGLFGVDDTNAVVRTYTARKNFYTLAQISKFVRPGAQRIGVSGSDSSLTPLLAFYHAGLGQVSIVGINTTGSAATLSGALASLPPVSNLDLYYTSATANLASGGSVAVDGGTFSATIPADCVFTLTGFTGVHVALTDPVSGAQFTEPATIPLAATAASTAGSIALVWYYNGATPLGEATVAPYGFTWNNVPMGNYALTAVAGDTLNNAGTSAVVNVTVAGPLAQIVVTPPTAAVVPRGGTQRFSATAADLMGHVLNPQPAFWWSVSGGGTIDGTGLFTAGSASGGPFSVTVASGGITGGASVTVVVVIGGTIGNTKEGTSTDMMWGNGAWINAGRFQAGSNMVVSAMHAKVGAIAGGYKCAIYADNGGSPGALLGGTAEVRNAPNGWNVFALTQSLVLTSGQYYWLAIWSDDTNAKVYYSDTSGNLRWGQYDYGAWPDPIATTGGSTLDYCLFARGEPPPTLTSIAVTPANPTNRVGTTQQFTAIGTYSDRSTQDITSQVKWVSSSTVLAAINTSGLAQGVTAGATTISAMLGRVSGHTRLTIQPPPLTITTTSLPGGAVGTAYTTKLAASGAIAPYTWSLAGGALPPGLTLTSTGTILGKPTTAGISSFTVRATAPRIRAETATCLLSLTISSNSTSGGLIGNATEGTLTDALWYSRAYIMASGFQAASNMVVSTMRAKVATIPGNYKCAIYSNVGGHPGGLLVSTAEVNNPASGWQSFPLTSSVALTKGSYYWLAIWSDDANARVYYSGNTGTLCSRPCNYGTWPDPIGSTVGISRRYCIYARQ